MIPELIESTTSLGRLSETRTFRDAGMQLWSECQVRVVGAGNIGQRFTLEAVLSGAKIVVHDFGDFSPENAGTQWGKPGKRKVNHVVELAEKIAPGRAQGVCGDILHAGIGELAEATVLVNCSDDPSLDISLTRISNGLGNWYVRAALDGSGEREFGRVAVGHGGAGFSCLMCPYDMRDLFRHTPRTPCPQPSARGRTRAGGAIGTVVAGMALLQVQRLVTGNDLDRVIDHEWLIDLDSGQLLVIRRPRVEECLSQHLQWNLTTLPLGTSDSTLSDLFRETGRQLGMAGLTLEPYGHPLCRAASCACGEYQLAVGTRWAEAPRCPACGKAMEWSLVGALDRLTLETIHDLEVDDIPLDQLGFPSRGPMFVARAPAKPPWRIVLC